MKRLSHKQLRGLLALTAIMLLLTMSLAGCKKDTEEPDPTDNVSETAAPTPETEATEPTVPATEAPSVMGTVNTDKLNVRTDPDSASPSIQKLAVGTRIEILEQRVVGEVTWGKIADGWVNMKYVTIDGEESTDAETPTEPEATQAPEADDKTEGTNGTITASELNIRSGPGTNYKATGVVKKGDKVVILEKSGNWGRTKDGWVSLKYVKLDGTVSETDDKDDKEEITVGTSTDKVVIITASELNIRSTAGTNGKKVGAYVYGDQVKITEQTTVDGSTWGKTSKGWISMKYTYVQGEKGDNAGTGTVTADKLNVRSGPGTDYKKVDQVKSGDKVDIYTQIKIGKETWGYTSDGWVNMQYVKMG